MAELPSSRDTLLVRNTDTTRLRLSGDIVRAKQYIGVAQTYMGWLRNTIALGGIDHGARHLRLADGVVIKMLWDGVLNIISIFVPPTTDEAGEGGDLLIYEFAAANSAASINLVRWFRLWFRPQFAENPTAKWRAEVADAFIAQKLPRSKIGDGKVCITTGSGLLRCSASKEDHITWQGGKDDARPVQGAGNMVSPLYTANRYCNYMVPIKDDEQIVWYGTCARGGAYDFGTPVARGLRAIDGVTVAITVMPTGAVRATRNDTGKTTTSAEPALPAWTKANELGLGKAFGVWKLNSDCTRAISVLHGNPWVFDAYDPGFNIGDLFTSEDPAISGGFQSAIFELEIGIELPPNGDPPEVSVATVLFDQISYVGTAGLVFGTPEKHSDGEYYYAADYNTEDEIVWAKIEYYLRDIFKVEIVDYPVDPSCEMKNVYSIYPGSYKNTEPWLDPCSIGEWGTRYKQDPADNGLIRWRNSEFVRTKDVKKDIRLTFSPNASLEAVDLVKKDEVNVLTGSNGFKRGSTFDLWSDGALGSLDYAGLIRAQATCAYTPCGIWHIVTGGFGGITSAHQLDLVVTRNVLAEVEESKIINLDLRAGVVITEHQIKYWNGGDTGHQEGDSNIAPTPANIVATLFESGYTTQSEYRVQEPQGEQTGVLAVLATVADETTEATSNLIAESYSVAQSDEDDYPLVTKLWHHMVLGKPNPKTPDGFGGFIGPYGNLGEYYPYQMITGFDSINWHPNGSLAFRYKAAGLDAVRYVDPQGDLHEISHDEILDMFENSPLLTDEDKTNLRQQSLSTRGEWVFS